MNKTTSVAILGTIVAVAALAAALPTVIHTAYAASSLVIGSTSGTGSLSGSVSATTNNAAAAAQSSTDETFASCSGTSTLSSLGAEEAAASCP